MAIFRGLCKCTFRVTCEQSLYFTSDRTMEVVFRSITSYKITVLTFTDTVILNTYTIPHKVKYSNIIYTVGPHAAITKYN